jgi:hypothetical protein
MLDGYTSSHEQTPVKDNGDQVLNDGFSNFKFEAVDYKGSTNVVYQYSIKLSKNDEVIGALNQQFGLAHRLYNDIITAARTQMERIINVLGAEAGEEYKVTANRLEELYARRRLARQVDDRETYEALTKEIKPLNLRRYQLLHETRKQSLHGKAMQKALFQNGPGGIMYDVRCSYTDRLNWATANAVLEAAMDACKKTWARFDLPRHHRFEEMRQFVVEHQFNSGALPVADLSSTDPKRKYVKDVWLSSENVNKNQWGDANFRGSKVYSPFSYRIGTSKTGFWNVTGTCYVHRPLPAGALIQSVRLIKQKVGPREKFYIQFCLQLAEEPRLAPPVGEKKNLVALDLGWYFEADGRRVYALADGPKPDLAKLIQLPKRIDDLFDKAERIKSERDTARDDIVTAFRSIDFSKAPDELKERAGKIRAIQKIQWVSQAKFGSFIWYWESRFPDFSPETRTRFADWLKDDRADWTQQAHATRHAINARRKFYEAKALEIVRTYKMVIIDKPDLVKAAEIKNSKTGKHNNLGPDARNGRVRTALYELEKAIAWAAARGDTILGKIIGPTTRTCPVCGREMSKDHAGSRVSKCACGNVVDRDKSAASVAWIASDKRRSWIKKNHEEAVQKHSEKNKERASKQAMRQQSRKASARSKEGGEPRT